jgi:hypothetical protein
LHPPSDPLQQPWSTALKDSKQQAAQEAAADGDDVQVSELACCMTG